MASSSSDLIRQMRSDEQPLLGLKDKERTRSVLTRDQQKSTEAKTALNCCKLSEAAHQRKNSASETQKSLCHSDELTIVREHMHFIVGLLIAPDFKRMVNWLSL